MSTRVHPLHGFKSDPQADFCAPGDGDAIDVSGFFHRRNWGQLLPPILEC